MLFSLFTNPRALLFEIDVFRRKTSDLSWSSVFNWESAVRESSEGFISEHFQAYRIYLYMFGGGAVGIRRFDMVHGAGG